MKTDSTDSEESFYDKFGSAIRTALVTVFGFVLSFGLILIFCGFIARFAGIVVAMLVCFGMCVLFAFVGSRVFNSKKDECGLKKKKFKLKWYDGLPQQYPCIIQKTNGRLYIREKDNKGFCFRWFPIDESRAKFKADIHSFSNESLYLVFFEDGTKKIKVHRGRRFTYTKEEKKLTAEKFLKIPNPPSSHY